MKPSTHTQSRRIGRRNYMRAMVGGATAVGAGSVGVTLGSSDARAVLPAIGVGAAIATGAAAGYLMNEVQDYVTGPDVDSSRYTDLAEDQFRASAREDMIEMQYYDDQVLTQVNNLLSNAPNASYSDAKYAAIEQMNMGNTESDATSAATDAVDKFYSVQLTNVLEHWNVQFTKHNAISTTADTNSYNMDKVNIFYDPGADATGTAWGSPGNNETTQSYSLPNGSSIAVKTKISGTSNYDFTPLSTGGRAELWVVNDSISRTDLATDSDQYADIVTKIENQHSTVKSEIQTWVSNVYPSYTSGDISLEDMISASDLADKAPNEQGFSYAGADLALLGIEGADHRYKIDLKTDEQIVTGTIYAEGRTESLDIGTVYSPSSISGTVWLAYETSDGEGGTVSDLIGLQQDFEILSGIDQNGEEVNEVTFSGTNQQTIDTDIQKMQKQLQQIQDLQNKLEEQQQQEVTSGGGGVLPEGQLIDGISNKILGAGAVAVAIYGAISS
jgi:hypothetical protein